MRYKYWAQIEALRKNFRVIAFDNRGAGESTQVDEPVTTADLAADTLQLMDHLGVPRAQVVGRSMGGAIAQHMALQAPGLSAAAPRALGSAGGCSTLCYAVMLPGRKSGFRA